MSRPCRWPPWPEQNRDGCGVEVEFFPTGKTKPDGKPVLQVVDAEPALINGIIPLRESQLSDRVTATKIVPAVYVDHHATCEAWAKKVERERAAKATKP
jgi:hypothetical protein